jgi:hypothetical protein
MGKGRKVSAEGTYARFAAGLRPGARGSRGVNVIDEAPGAMEDLAAYFLALEPARLAACWVACVVDASMHRFATADIARALVVVAERLHGVAGGGELTGRGPGPATDVRAGPSPLSPSLRSGLVSGSGVAGAAAPAQ